ncbi:MAG: SCO family protein [Gaiellaceae bacterium MAG52_C11]|nr:SCO family protein [Candidatus Gaiellasilicea maunaloa]
MTSAAENPKNPRRRNLLVLLAALLVALLVVGAVGFAARFADRAAPSGTGPYHGSEPPAVFKLPPFELTSYRGGRVDSATLAGDVVLLTILDAQCTDVCPILASVIAGTIDRLTPAERKQVRALAISGDPAEDTPTAVRQFLSKRRAVGRLDYLVGSEEQLRPIWTALQILPSLDSGQDSLHSAPLRIYDRGGTWVATLHSGADLNEENLLHDIRTALAADSG